MERKQRERVTTPVGTRSRTKQAPAVEAAAGTIVERYRQTRDPRVLMQRPNPGRYGNFESARDLYTAMCLVKDAQQAFRELPAEVRDYVDNDPVQLLELVHDPERIDECRELGLVPQQAGKDREQPASSPTPSPTPGNSSSSPGSSGSGPAGSATPSEAGGAS